MQGILILIFLIYLQQQVRSFNVSANSLRRNLIPGKNKHAAQMAMVTKEGEYGYGMELPSFAFDYSEYFVSATITRQRYLTMILIGHRIIYEDYPIEAISTEYENMEHWNQATKFWTKPKKYNVRPRLQQMFCVIHNHNDHSTAPYQVPATWLRVSSKSLNDTGYHSNFNRHIEMLRCPLHHLSKQNLVHMDLDIDVYRKATHAPHEHAPNTAVEKVHLISFSVPWGKSYTGYPTIPQFNVKSLLPITAEKMQAVITDSTIVDAAATVRTVPTHHKPVSIIACIPGIRLAHIRRSETGWAMLVEFVAHLFHHGVDQIILGVTISETSSHFLVSQTLLNTLYPQQTVLLVPTAIPHYDDVPGFIGLQLSDNFADVFFLNQCLYLLKGKEFAHLQGHGGSSKFMLVMRVNQLLVPNSSSKSLKSILSEVSAETLLDSSATRHSVSGAFLGNTAISATSGSAEHGHNRHNHNRGKDAENKQGIQGLDKHTASNHRVLESEEDLSIASITIPTLKSLPAQNLRGKSKTSRTTGPSSHVRRPSGSDSSTSLSRYCSIQVSSSSFSPQYHFISDPLTVFDDHGPGHFAFMRDFFNESIPRTLGKQPSKYPWLVSLINIDKAVAIDVHTTEELIQQFGSDAASASTRTKNGRLHSDLSAAHAIVYPICVQSASSGPTVSSPQSSTEHGIMDATFMHVNTYVAPAYPQDHLVEIPPAELSRVQANTFDIYQRLHIELESACQRLVPSNTLNLTTASLKSGLESTIKGASKSSEFTSTVDSEVVNLIRPVCTNAGALKLVVKHINDERNKLIRAQRLADSDPIDNNVIDKTRTDIKPPFWQICNTAHLSEILRKVFFNGK